MKPISETVESWNGVVDYEQEIISLAHRPAGATIREIIAGLDLQGKYVADLGVGPGYFLQDLAGAEKIYAVDWSETMLSCAAARAPENTIFLKQNLNSLDLPHPIDFALCFNALFQENHTTFLKVFRRIFKSLSSGGTLLLVLPSLEGLLYAINMFTFSQAGKGRESVAIRQVEGEFKDSIDNVFGYGKGKGGQVAKYWMRDEVEAVVRACANVSKCSSFKARLAWSDFFPSGAWCEDLKEPWAWGFIITVS